VKELKEAWEVMEKEGKGKGTLKPQRLTRTAAREAAEKAEAQMLVMKEVVAQKATHKVRPFRLFVRP
jgi:hypothetical protein